MYARMTVAEAQADRVDEAVSAVQNAFVPAAREHQGYRGFLLLVDAEARRLVGISLWETEADRERSSGSSGYYQSQVAEFAQLLVNPPATTNLEVAVHELPPAPNQ